MEKLVVGLEWFLNPDHLPLILGMKKGWFSEQNLEIEMIEPEQHFDALEEIENGSMDIAITEPIHLVEYKAMNENVVGFCSISTYKWRCDVQQRQRYSIT